MAQVKISALPEAASVLGTDVVSGVESAATKKIKVETLLAAKMINNSVWGETRAAFNSFKTSPTIAPSFEKLTDDGAGSRGVWTYVFSHDRDEEGHFAIHLPSEYKLGTDFYPTFHFIPGDTNTGNVKIDLEYYPTSGALGNSTVITATLALDGVREHKDLNFTAVNGAGFTTIDNQFIIRCMRDVGVGSNYAERCFILELTVKFEKDQIGTGTRTAK